MNKKKSYIRSTKKSAKAKSESNDQAHHKIMHNAGQMRCNMCPPWKHDNAVAHVPKRGTKKPKYKNKRK